MRRDASEVRFKEADIIPFVPCQQLEMGLLCILDHTEALHAR
jgi:hypothetical protein